MTERRPGVPVETREISRTDGAWMIFLIFLRLWLTSFGGPIAHLGLFSR